MGDYNKLIRTARRVYRKTLRVPRKNATLAVGSFTVLEDLQSVEETADLVFVDPPFNIGVDYGGTCSDNKAAEQYAEFIRSMMTVSTAVLRPGGMALIHIPPQVVPLVYAAVYGDDLPALPKSPGSGLLRLVNNIILVQEFGQHTRSKFITGHVQCLCFAKDGGKRTFNYREVLEPSTRLLMGDKRVQSSPDKGYRVFTDVWAGQYLGRVQGNNAERRALHPNQVGELYMSRLLRAYANKGDVVVDLCTGSGTTGVVAASLGMKFFGVEINPQFARSACRRIANGPVRNVKGPLYFGPSKIDKAAAVAE